jgi:cysteine desulfurase NifS
MGGGTPVGPKAWREWNVNELTDVTNYDEISGFPVYKALLCDVRRIGTQGEQEGGFGASASKPAEIRPEVSLPPARAVTARIYLDNNATTKVADAVRDEMLPFLDVTLGNPSSIHRAGREAREAVENARRQVARLLHTRPRRIIFTGGGSEANNLAIKGTAFRHRGGRRHIITTRIEHPAVLSTCAFLEEMGYRITYLEVDADGWVTPEALEGALTDETILVSIMMANNEVGTILPIRELCSVAHARNVLFHSDAVQAAGKISVDVEDLGIDLLSISAHKFHGPKGIGALWVRKDVPLVPLIHGGRQERGLRAGTENVPAIVGMGKAAELALRNLEESTRVKELRDRLEQKIRELVPGATLNGRRQERLPGTLNMTVPGLRGESLVVALDQHGISLSSGSACKSGSPEPTHVLIAMGRSAEEAHCSIRLSLSHYTTAEEIERVGMALQQVLEEMEMTVRFLPCK